MFFVWTHPKWHKRTKWIITGSFFGLIVLGSLGRQDDKPDNGKSQGTSSDQSSPTKVRPMTSSKAGSEEVIAVAGTESDRKKWEAASRPNALSFSGRKVSDRVGVFKSIVKKLKDFPDRLASEKQDEKFRSELQKLIDEFCRIPFNGSYQTEDARTIIELWETEIENKYQGHQYNLLKDEVASIFQQYRSRPE